MKHFTIILLTLFALISYAAEPISVTVNPKQDVFTISLPSNPSTGYLWRAKTFDRNLFTLIGDNYNKAKGAMDVIGASGTTTFTFKLVKNAVFPEMSSMVFYHSRPWDPGSGSDQVVYITFKSWD